jgi:hypothetical protein
MQKFDEGVKMPGKETTAFLNDFEILIEAYAASSPYVMREAFMRIKQFDSFKGRQDLAPDVIRKLSSLIKKPKDPVIIAAHLYALELIGQKKELRSSTSGVLGNNTLVNDPMVGQFAGQIGYRLLYPRRKLDPNAFISIAEMKKIASALKEKED